jgi:hypothetical protein
MGSSQSLQSDETDFDSSSTATEDKQILKNKQTRLQIQQAKKMLNERKTAKTVVAEENERLERLRLREIQENKFNTSLAIALELANAEKNAEKYEKQADIIQAEEAAKLAELARQQVIDERKKRKKQKEEELNDMFFKSFGGRTSKKRDTNLKNKYKKDIKYTKRRRMRKSKKYKK